jgi:hypothetical protein
VHVIARSAQAKQAEPRESLLNIRQLEMALAVTAVME